MVQRILEEKPYSTLQAHKLVRCLPIQEAVSEETAQIGFLSERLEDQCWIAATLGDVRAV